MPGLWKNPADVSITGSSLAAALSAMMFLPPIEVTVSEDIADSTLIENWIYSRMPKMLGELPREAGSDLKTLEIEVSGSDYDFTYTIDAEVLEGPPFVVRTETCSECTKTQLVEQVAGSVTALLQERAQQNEAETAGQGTSQEPDGEHDDPRPSDTGKAKRVGGLGWAGVGLSALGLGLSIGGAVLSVQDVDTQRQDEPYRLTRTDRRPNGWALLGAGIGTLAVGVVFIVVDQTVLLKRRRARAGWTRWRVSPMVGADTRGMAFSGRF